MSSEHDPQQPAAGLPAPEPVDAETQQRHVRLSHGACRVARDHWTALAERLNAAPPPSPARYVFGGRRALEAMRCTRFQVTHRSRLDLHGDEYFEFVALSWRATNGERVRVEQSFPADIERLRTALNQGGITAVETPIRDTYAGRTRGVLFEFNTEVVASIRITPLAESGRVRLVGMNVDQLERVESEFAASKMRLKQLDELARWILGQPQRALEQAIEVKRFVP